MISAAVRGQLMHGAARRPEPRGLKAIACAVHDTCLTCFLALQYSCPNRDSWFRSAPWVCGETNRGP
eukprot:11135236-Lingulodinium_polyedra.AAC.1